MITEDRILYESADVWDQPLQLGQKNLLQAVIDFFPTDVSSALDVGCGDGKLTQAIINSTKCAIVGLDFSQEALSRCEFDTICGDAANLHFEDKKFDLVFSLDMLEHLSEDLEELVWKQLFRVAKKWVMVAVPFREELMEATTKCFNCGKLYHVNWHMRSYDWKELVLRTPEEFEVSKIILTGEERSPYHGIEIKLRRQVWDEWSGWKEAFCFHCKHQGREPDPIERLPSLIEMALGNMIYSARKNEKIQPQHSEILILYKRKNIDFEEQKAVPKALSLPFNSNKILLNDLHFEQNLIPYPPVTRAVRSINGDIILQFPAYSSYNSIVFKGEPGKTNSFNFSVEDGLGMICEHELTISRQKPYVLNFCRETVPSYYGILVRLPSGVSLKSVQLGVGLPVTLLKPAPHALASYNSIKLDSYPTYLQVVKPCWINNKSLSTSPSSNFDTKQLCLHMQQLYQKETTRFQMQTQELRNEIERLTNSSQHE